LSCNLTPHIRLTCFICFLILILSPVPQQRLYRNTRSLLSGLVHRSDAVPGYSTNDDKLSPDATLMRSKRPWSRCRVGMCQMSAWICIFLLVCVVLTSPTQPESHIPSQPLTSSSAPHRLHSLSRRFLLARLPMEAGALRDNCLQAAGAWYEFSQLMQTS